MKRTQFEREHEEFRATVTAFIAEHVLPNAETWRENRIIDRECFLAAGAAGLIGLQVPTDFGGRGTSDYRFNQIVLEEFERAGLGPFGTGIMLQNDIVLPYLERFAAPEQLERWVPAICRGEKLGSLAITEPDAGSDIAGIATTAVKTTDGYVVNGSKTYIGTGVNADFSIVVARTDPDSRHHGLSLLVVEDGTPGYSHDRNLPREGREAQDVAHLTFSDVFVPTDNLLGEENRAFGYLMQNLVKERLQVAVSAVASCHFMFDTTLEYIKNRQAFGQSIGSFQYNKFMMAELATEIEFAEAYVDRAVLGFAGDLVDANDAAMAKWWCTELQNKVAATCMQLHGGHGYMANTAIARSWRDARVTTIYGGTTEIMKEIIGRSLGL